MSFPSIPILQQYNFKVVTIPFNQQPVISIPPIFWQLGYCGIHVMNTKRTFSNTTTKLAAWYLGFSQ
jgi:hypothetical protein